MGRIILTAITLTIFTVFSTIYNAATTVQSGDFAGAQFAASDKTYLGFQIGIAMVSAFNNVFVITTLVIIFTIWYKPLCQLTTWIKTNVKGDET